MCGLWDATDEAEDRCYGKGYVETRLPEELRFKETRLAKIKEAKSIANQQ